MAPRVSVIIPAYNHEAYVGEAITSVLAQSLADFELIIIDDGSTDRTKSVIESFSDPRIVFHSQENRGAHAALNRGLEEARGEFIAILNSDDRYHPDRLARLHTALKREPETELAVSAVDLIDSSGRKTQAEWLERGLKFYRESGDIFAAVIRDNFICTTSNFFFRRRLLERTGPFLPLRYCHDLDFLLQGQLAGKIHYCDEPQLDYRVHAGNTIKEADTEKGGLFKFEVAAVVACALSGKGLAAAALPGFVAGLEETQLGQLLEGVALLVPLFIAAGPRRRQQLAALLGDEGRRQRSVLVDFIKAREVEKRRPWELYEELRRYNLETRQVLERLERENREIWEQSQAFAGRVAELDEIVADRNQRITYLEKVGADLDATLAEIYRSRGWRWLVRYRRIVDFFRRGRG